MCIKRIDVMHYLKLNNGKYIKKQPDYKPGSVPFLAKRRLSFIHAVCHHTALAFYPLARTSNPQAPVYMNLQPPACTADVSPHLW